MKDKVKEKSDVTASEYRLAVWDMIYLLRCALNEQPPDQDRLQCGRTDLILAAAKRHMLTSAVSMSLETGGIKSELTGKAIASVVRKASLFQSALSEVEIKLNEAGIWHIPLKGIILQHLYPRYGMREMADHDILIDPDRAGDVKDIMESLGFTTMQFGRSNQDVYQKPPVLNFEMHTGLFGASHEGAMYEYYLNIGDRLLRSDSCKREFTPEDFYIYMIAHEYKHFSGSGTGLRSLADTCVYLSRHSLDMDYVKRETEKLGLSDYEAANRSLAVHLLGNGELTEEDREMLDYILSSGTYGTIVHRIENRIRKNHWSKLNYMIDRFLVPVSPGNRQYNAYAEAYPFFYRHKLFLPLLPFYRTARAIRRGSFMKEARAIRQSKLKR